jgi:hypothetical protein
VKLINAKRVDGLQFQVHFMRDDGEFFENHIERMLTAWMKGRVEKYSFDYGFSTTTVTFDVKEEFLEETKTFMTLVAIGGTTAFETI